MSITGQTDGNKPVTRLLVINLYTEMGGGEFGMYYVLKNLDRSKVQPILLVNRRGPLSDMVEALGIEIVVIPFEVVMLKHLFTLSSLRANVRAALAIKRCVQERGIDAVFCADVFTLLLLIPAMLRFLTPVVYAVIFFYEQSRLLLFNAFALLCVKHIVVLSNAMKADLLKRSVGLSSKITTVHWGVDQEKFFPRPAEERMKLRERYQFPPEKKVVAFIGRYEVWKGHHMFIAAAEEILRERKDVVFLIAGGAMTEDVIPQVKKYHADVMNRIQSSPYREHFLVWNHRDDIPDVMAAIDLFVCPSHREPYGLVVLEALATGIPVVATRTVGALEVLSGVPGVYIAEQEHATALSHQIKTALNESKTQTSLSSKFQQILTSVSWDRYSRIIEAL